MHGRLTNMYIPGCQPPIQFPSSPPGCLYALGISFTKLSINFTRISFKRSTASSSLMCYHARKGYEMSVLTLSLPLRAWSVGYVDMNLAFFCILLTGTKSVCSMVGSGGGY